jgi:hypothetical protein
MRNRYVSMKETQSTARRREGMRATLKSAMTGGTGLGVLVLLFLASLAYVALGGTFALEASPVPESETSIAALAPEPVDVGGALRKEIVSARSETEN